MNSIYVLLDPQTREVRYVGKTRNPKARLLSHWYSKSRTYTSRWIQKIKANGLLPEMKIIESGLSESEWPDREKFWIQSYKESGSSLTNIAEGGKSTKSHHKKKSNGYALGFPYEGMRENEICFLTFDANGESIYNFVTLSDEWMEYVRQNNERTKQLAKHGSRMKVRST